MACTLRSSDGEADVRTGDGVAKVRGWQGKRTYLLDVTMVTAGEVPGFPLMEGDEETDSLQLAELSAIEALRELVDSEPPHHP